MLALEAGAARVVVDPDGGGRIERLDVDGLALLVPPEIDDHNYGCFPMAPWAGRVRHGRFTFAGVEYELPCNKAPHAIHGIARDRRWHIEHESPTRVELAVDLGEPWPFGGRVVQILDLGPDSLALTMEVHAGRSPMPASCGWHPWWQRDLARGAALELELHAGAMYVRDDEGIPTGELNPVESPPWDDCFTDLGEPAVAVLHWPGAATMTIETDCPCVVVYTEPEAALCVEPQSGPPDALNLAPVTVEPGAPLVVHATFHWAVDG
jgi:aldose 1-epimerase